MPHFICEACGTQFAETDQPPPSCPICEDERQFVPPTGQRWTTLDALCRSHHSTVAPQGELLGIGTEPKFGIGQRALLVRPPGGNVLWDCVSLLDDAAMQAVSDAGGLVAVAISHPHYYTTMVEWSRAFGGVPVYLHAADREWVRRPDPCLVFWEGDAHALVDGLTLVRCGGHFPGGTVLHWAQGAEGRGALLTGDILQVTPDNRFVTFMYSFPNHLPLPAVAVERVVAALQPFAFDRLYGAFWDDEIASRAADAVARSAERYLRAVNGGISY